MRIIAGRWKGHRLPAPVPKGIRPTQDAVREAIFNILLSRFDIEGKRVLDLFAGTGALGIEALSRGAGFCTFIDSSYRAVNAIERNCRALCIENDYYRIVRCDVLSYLNTSSTADVEVCFADPPYGNSRLAILLLEHMRSTALFATGALIVLEHQPSFHITEDENLVLYFQRRWGDTVVTLLGRR